MEDMDELAPGGKVKDHVVGCAFGPGIAIEMCMLKRNLGHVRRTLVTSGEITPPETDSEGSRSDGVQTPDIKEEIGAGKEVEAKGDSLEEALNGVELD